LATRVFFGASLAGATAAIALREVDPSGRIVLIGAEPEPPYERPPLSKGYLRGDTPFQNALIRPPGFYVEHAIETILGVRARRIDPGSKFVELEDDRRIPFDALLLATGSRNRPITIPGGTLPGIYSLRTVQDADLIRKETLAGRRAVVVGMGFIGAEVAASLRQKGVDVVAIDPGKTPLFRVLGAEVGQTIADLHIAHGVRTIFEDTVTSFEGTTHVRGVTTQQGTHIECDFAVVGIGVVPVTELAATAGIHVDNGIAVNEYCETNLRDIFAAGDVTNHYHPVFQRPIRVEHWQNAIKQGAIAARNMLGDRMAHDDIPWFWSDQYDTNTQYAGFHTTSERPVIRGNPKSGNYLAFYLNDDRIEAVVGYNRPRDIRRLLPVIRARQTVDPKALPNDDSDLYSIFR
jgi:3-phenylpropionate/trans-cinnamate dioxygenase ferredoxin reductase component